MKPNRVIIQFGGLGIGTHLFEFEVNSKFFESIEYSEIQKANVLASIEFVKQNSVMTLNFHIKGTVGITCDRCVGEYDLPIEGRETMYVKNGNVDESTDTLIVLPHGETEVDLTRYLYEFVVIALPQRRVPCEIDADKYKCDEETLKKLSGFKVEDEPIHTNNNVWDELKKIKFNNN